MKYKNIKEISELYLIKYILKIPKIYQNIFLDLLNKEIDALTLPLFDDKLNDIIGLYYYIKGNTKKTIEYWTISSMQGNVHSMNNLGIYYHLIDDKKNMELFYNFAIKNNYYYSYYNLGLYYQQKKEYDKMLYYYFLANKKGIVETYLNLGNYYEYIKDDNKALEMYLSGYELGDENCIIKLYLFYKNKYIKDPKYIYIEIANKYKKKIKKYHLDNVYNHCYYNQNILNKN